MMFSDATPSTVIPEQLYLEIPQSFPEQLQNQPFSTSGARWRAYLNQMSLEAFLPWLQQEQNSSTKVWTYRAALPSFWEFVNGTAIHCDNMRLVLIPTTALDRRELRVPQEWVDIPSWIADYYLAVEVNPNAGWATIWGYTTHYQLKSKGVYDSSDRTYSLNEGELIGDLNVLWIARQLCPEEPLRAQIAPTLTLSKAQAENLLERLGNPTIVFPRLTVPFPLWAALLEHGGWRQRLYEQRQGLSEQWSIPQWLHSGVSNVAQQLGWGTTPLQLIPRGVRSRETATSFSGLSRQLAIAGNLYELRVFRRGNPDEGVWRFELRSTDPNGLIPVGFKLRLLTEDLQPFVNNEDTATSAIAQLYIDVVLEPGEGLVWEIEPTPEECDREILRF